MEDFTPITGSIGGFLIGSAAAILLLFNGDIMGASGILNFTKSWKYLFVAAFTAVVQIVTYVSFSNDIVDKAKLFGLPNDLSTADYAIAGLLVGMGTKLGNGCTSGHGVCGLGAMRVRSFSVVLTFMTTGVLTATFVNPLKIGPPIQDDEQYLFSPQVGMMVTAAALLVAILTPQKEEPNKEVTVLSPQEESESDLGFLESQQEEINPKSPVNNKRPGIFLSAALFSSGLLISGMCNPNKVLGFLDVSRIADSTYDPTLVTVLGVAVPVSLFSYYIKGRMESPYLSDNWNLPTSAVVDFRLLAGAALFGIGWGWAGICPGPALVGAAAGVVPLAVVWFPSFFAGSWVAPKLYDFEFSL